MAYSQITLTALVGQISQLQDDLSAVYWTVPEIQYAIWESLRIFGAVTAYYRQRGTWNALPTDISPFYQLNVELANLRTRTWTLNDVVLEIQYALLENPSGIAGTGGSGQVSINTILQAIQRARNRFCIDTKLPNSIHPNFAPVTPPQGLVTFPQSSIYVHRASWQDSGGAWVNLWRQDEWTFDHSQPNDWPTNAAPLPKAYSEATLAPLQLQIYPNPQNAGTLEAVTVDSYLVDVANPNETLQIPDEWAWVVKYAALAEILTGGNQIVDPLRAQFAEQMYQQGVAFAKDARSLIRLTCNGNPLQIDSLAAIDAGQPYWRNQVGMPQMAGVLYDIVALNPGRVDQRYGIGADVVIPAPLPTSGQFIPIGEENLQDIIDKAVNYLLFKCGGNEFKSTMGLLDNFQRAMALRKGVNAAKIRYFEPLFGQWQRELAHRPDAKEMAGKG